MKNVDGLYLGMNREDYDALDTRLNWSWLKHMKRSPLHFQSAKTEAEKDTDALRLGRATHVSVLEPERFLKEWCVFDGPRRQGAVWESFKEDAATKGMEILTRDQAEKVIAITDAIRSHREADSILKGGHAEASVLWTCEEPANGLPGFKLECKSRLDVAKAQAALVDLKTCRDAAPEPFARAAWNLDYYSQLAMYRDAWAAVNGGELLPVIIVAVENTSPHVVQVYDVPEHILQLGQDTYRGLMRQVSESRKAEHWEGYAPGRLELQLPRWMRTDEDDLTGLDLQVGEAVV